MKGMVNLFVLIIFCTGCFSQRELETYDRIDTGTDEKRIEVELFVDRLEVNPGEGVRMRCEVVGSDIGDIDYRWEASGGRIFGQGSNVVWIAPEQDELVKYYKIRCIVDGNNLVRDKKEVIIKVKEVDGNNGRVMWRKQIVDSKIKYYNIIVADRWRSLIGVGLVPDIIPPGIPIHSIFLSKFDLEGNKIFEINIGNSKRYNENFIKVGTDVYGNIFLLYYHTIEDDINRNYEIIIDKYDIQLKKLWTKIFLTKWYPASEYFEIGEEGDLYSPDYEINDMEENAYDIFITRYNSEGNKMWKLKIEEIGWIRSIKKVGNKLFVLWDKMDESYKLISIDIDGRIVKNMNIGNTLQTLWIGRDWSVYFVIKDIGKYFVIKYDDMLNLVWKRYLVDEHSNYDCSDNFYLNSNGSSLFIVANLYAGEKVCGWYTPPGPNENCRCKFYNMIVKYDLDGNEIWRIKNYDSEVDYLGALWSDAIGNVYTMRSKIWYAGLSNGGWKNEKSLGRYNLKGEKIWEIILEDILGYPNICVDFENNIYIWDNIVKDNESNNYVLLLTKID